MKIKSLEIENFKLFEKPFEQIKEISQTDLILLNGPNGYGKTTVFDAIELAVTGQVKRIISYSDDLGIAKNESMNKKVLIADDTKRASVSLCLEQDGTELKLQRIYEPSKGKQKEKQKEKENKLSLENNPYKIPILLKRKVFINQNEIAGAEEQNQILEKFHLLNIEEFYDKCCFLSQDEHLQFIKEGKKNKAEALHFLFEESEEQKQEQNKLDQVMQSVKNLNKKNSLGYLTKMINHEQELVEEIAQLQTVSKDRENEIPTQSRVSYARLFPEKSVKWDQENAKLSAEEFEEAKKAIDNLLFYSENRQACLNYHFNKPYKDLLKPFDGGEISFQSHPLEFVLRYHALVQKGETLETQYHIQQNLKQIKEQLEKHEINKINWEIALREKLLDNDAIKEIRDRIDQIEDLKSAQDSVSAAITSILEARDALMQNAGSAMDQKILNQKECPYCGASYGDRKELDQKIAAETKKLQSLCDGSAIKIQEKTEELYQQYLNPLKTDIDQKLQDCISDDTFDTLQKVKKEKAYMDQIKDMLMSLNITLPERYTEDVTELSGEYDKLTKRIQDSLKDIPRETDELLTAKDFELDLNKYFDAEESKFLELTSAVLQEKLRYVKRSYYDSEKEVLVQKQKELNTVTGRRSQLEKIYDDLTAYKEAVESGKTEYRKKVIQDIEPLLYVYTAKILQQKFNGKSIFILMDEQMKNFQLINSVSDNQDILYNMSSGQLAAVSLSFLLCMSQVYARQQGLPILLIDDPIQTIDDVNMVGLVDILRFEFEKTQIFISTHEQKFERYLLYKYEKAGKKIQSYNMKNLVLQTVSQ